MATCASLSVVLVLSSLVLTCSGQRLNLFTLSDPTYLRSGRQQELVRVPGIPLGEGTQDSILVWRNGLVTFGAASAGANLTVPHRDFSAVEPEYLVAPLWFPNVSAELVNVSVAWEIEREEDEGGYLLEFAKTSVEEYSLLYHRIEGDFSPTWAMIVSWNVTLSPDPFLSHVVCQEFFNCLCQDFNPFYYYYYYYEEEETNATETDDGSSCPTQLCFADHGLSHQDVAYLNILCKQSGEHFFFYYVPPVEFQLVLATDGTHTHSLFLYKCDREFSYDRGVFNFIYNHTSTGHRLGSLHDNYTCVNNDIPSLFRCDFSTCYSAFDSSYFYIDTAATHLRNLTNGFDGFKKAFGSLVEGQDFIPFQLLYSDILLGYTNGTKSSSGTNSTDSTPLRVLSRQLDGSSDVILHSGVAVGTTTQTKIYVGTNGIISFGRPFYFWYSQNFPTRYPWIRDTYVAAPFWMDIDIRSRGNVIYTTLTPEDSSDIFYNISTFLTFQTNATFEADWLLLVTWAEVPIYPHYYVEKYSRYYSNSYRERILNDFNTFEAIVASSGPLTYVIYTYHCELLTNPGLYRGAVIGYNLGGFEFENHRLSETLVANRVACGNWPASNWFNLVYQLNSGEDAILQAKRECLTLLQQDKLVVSDEQVKEVEKELSPCPCTIRNAWRDRNFRWDSENFYCYYRRLANELTGEFDQYCCYDTNFGGGTWGALVKSGYRASGMVRMEETRFGRVVSTEDQQLRRVCCGLAGLCDLLFQRRPINNCFGYQPPVWTWAWGDPHIMTLDGHSYTFNGYGEYVMLRYDDSVGFQARMRPTNGTRATQFSAFSFGYFTDSRVEIDCGGEGPFCVTLYNGTDISSQLSTVNDSFYSSADKIEVVRETETTVTVVLGAGLALAVSYNKTVGIPSFQLNLPKLSGTMVGLLGNMDDDSTNDLVYQNGTILVIATATDQDIFDFGSNWLITNGTESLFTYNAGEEPLTYHDPAWSPVFTAELMETASSEVIAACTPTGSSTPLEQCVFDAVATNDVTIGMATADTLSENTVAMMESTNMPPVISSDSEGVLSISTSSHLTLTLTVTDDTDSTPSLSLITPPPGSTLSPSPGQPGSFIFTWQLQELTEDEQLPALVFAATDSLGATATFSPAVDVCACLNGGNCTHLAASSPTNLLVLTCICHPAWEGSYCQSDVDGCLEFACAEGVECIDVPAPGYGADCGPCPLGYSDDGNKCADIDECTVESPCQQICTNTDGSYECSCNHGYVVNISDPTKCLDYNECSSLLEDCEQLCTNTEGSFLCSCNSGFISDGPFCFPENECYHGYSGCGSALCANISGEPTCYCQSGYEIDSEGTVCVDNDECLSGACHDICTNFPGTFHCSCRHGYQITSDLVSCVDVDECESARERGERLCGAGESCLNMEGEYQCVCSPGLYLTFLDPITTSCGNPPVIESFMEHSVIATFSSVTEDQLLEEGGLDRLSEKVAEAVKSYCSQTVCKVEGVRDEGGLTKRHAHLTTYDPSQDLAQPVFDLNGLESGSSGVWVPFYVVVSSDGESNGVLVGEYTLAAIQASVDEFEGQFGGFSVSLLFPPPSPSPGTQQPPVTLDDEDTFFDTAVVAGVTAAAAVVGVVLSVTLALVLYFCVEWQRRKKNSGSKTHTRTVLRESMSWSDDGKGERASEMKEVPPQGPRMTEDPGRTIIVNENTA